MATQLIGDIIDKLSIINIKIWDATRRAHEAYKQKDHKVAHDLFDKVETMNIQRVEYVNIINKYFSKRENASLRKSFNDGRLRRVLKNPRPRATSKTIRKGPTHS